MVILEMEKEREKEKEDKARKVQPKKTPAVPYVESKPKKTKKKFVEYASNDSVLGKLDAGKDIGLSCSNFE